MHLLWTYRDRARKRVSVRTETETTESGNDRNRKWAKLNSCVKLPSIESALDMITLLIFPVVAKSTN